jgi:hypothetical protein
MGFLYESDNIRLKKIKFALEHPTKIVDDWSEDDLEAAEDLTLVAAEQYKNDLIVKYSELWNENCLNSLFQKPEYDGLESSPLKAINKFFKERFTAIAKALGLEITEYDVYPTDYIGEAILTVEMVKYGQDKELDEIMAEADFLSRPNTGDPRYQADPQHVRKPLPLDKQQMVSPKGGMKNVPVSPDNRYNQVYITKNKPQDPKMVDMLLKTTFDDKFDTKYTLSTDVGEWHPVKTLRNEEEKLVVHWEHDQTNKVKIVTTFFPQSSNKIKVNVVGSDGTLLIDTDFEIYRIPTDSFLVERFFRKIYFSLMKKFVNTQVVKQEPFKRSFVFWKSSVPNFSYSFSEPNKNQIVLNLIAFIKTAQRPILDDFFEQNNLKHKQGYLQTLLDAAEDAGIFEFKRHGNEVLVQKGINFKAFLEGRIRKI